MYPCCCRRQTFWLFQIVAFNNTFNVEATPMSMMGKWINKIWHIYIMIIYILKGNPVTFYNMDEPKGHYVLWCQSEQTLPWFYLWVIQSSQILNNIQFWSQNALSIKIRAEKNWQIWLNSTKNIWRFKIKTGENIKTTSQAHVFHLYKVLKNHSSLTTHLKYAKGYIYRELKWSVNAYITVNIH